MSQQDMLYLANRPLGNKVSLEYKVRTCNNLFTIFRHTPPLVYNTIDCIVAYALFSLYVLDIIITQRTGSKLRSSFRKWRIVHLSIILVPKSNSAAFYYVDGIFVQGGWLSFPYNFPLRLCSRYERVSVTTAADAGLWASSVLVSGRGHEENGALTLAWSHQCAQCGFNV